MRFRRRVIVGGRNGINSKRRGNGGSNRSEKKERCRMEWILCGFKFFEGVGVLWVGERGGAMDVSEMTVVGVSFCRIEILGTGNGRSF
jgi:hypothetical protein